MGPKRQDRHKKVECDVCNKLMRSDHLKRHKQTHRDLLSLPVNEISKMNQKRDKKSRKSRKKGYKKLRKLQKRITQQSQTKLPAESANLLIKLLMFAQDAYKTNNFTQKRLNQGNKQQLSQETAKQYTNRQEKQTKKLSILTENISKSIYLTSYYVNGKKMQ